MISGGNATVMVSNMDAASPKYPAPGTKGGILLAPGVSFVTALNLTPEDPDGNAIYLWEVNRAAIPETELTGAGWLKR